MVSIRTLVTSALALAAPIAAQTTPPQTLVNQINVLTQQSQALQPIAEQLTVVDTTLLFVGQGRYAQVIGGLNAQVQTITADMNQMQNMVPITDATQATDVYNAWRSVRPLTSFLYVCIPSNTRTSLSKQNKPSSTHSPAKPLSQTLHR